MKPLLLKVKAGSLETGLQLNFKKAKVMTTGYTASKLTMKKLKLSQGFLFLGSINQKNNQEIRKRLNVERAAMKELRKILKCGNVPLVTKIKLIHAMVFAITV